MKRILIYLLLLANLCSGLAFAWDSHPEGLAGHEVTALDTAADEIYAHFDGNLHHGNHCCHGAAHLTGIIYSATGLVATGNPDQRSFQVSALPSLYIAPLLRPPII